MSDEMKDYVDNFRASLPAGITYDSDIARYFCNNRRFFNEWEVERYLNYITKFGFSAAFDPVADLFGAGELGALVTADNLSGLWQDVDGTVPVTADGDPVARADDLTPNGINWVQPVSSKRPIYRTDGTHHWFEFDGIDDGLDAAIDMDGATWDAAMSYAPAGRDFIAFSNKDEFHPWFIIGQNNSFNTSIEGECTQNALYFDNTLSTTQHRAGQYNLSQAANVTHGNFTVPPSPPIPWQSVRVGQYRTDDPWTTPGPVYAFMIRQGTMSGTQRTNLAQWMADKQGITL